MVIAFFARCGLGPGKQPKIFDDRITDDRFAMTFEVNHETTTEEIQEIHDMLISQGAVEVKLKDFDETEY
jgi:hypothetical protein